MKKLTKRQAQTLTIIIRTLDEEGRPPAIRDIGEEMEIASTNGVNDHLKALERKGYLTRGEPGEPRTLRPLRRPDGQTYCPGAGYLIRMLRQGAELPEGQRREVLELLAEAGEEAA